MAEVGKVPMGRDKIPCFHNRSGLSRKRCQHSFMVPMEPGFLNQIRVGVEIREEE